MVGTLPAAAGHVKRKFRRNGWRLSRSGHTPGWAAQGHRTGSPTGRSSNRGLYVHSCGRASAWAAAGWAAVAQEHCIGSLVKSSHNDIIYQEDRDLQLSIFMDKSTPQVGLWNLCWIPIPLHDFTTDLDIQRPETPGDLDRLGAADRMALDVLIGVGNPVPREKLPRAIAGRSSRAIVQHDVSHDSPPAASTRAPAPALKPRTLSHSERNHRVTRPRYV